ncbi:MAG: DUF4097 family beta strand repeat protein [Lachnospiraceae bacterium]|nr:DUF4097 family beta strand repeat protein [Lachnospiraceae bacterium]
MKKMTKVLLLLAFIFIVLGGIITAIGVFFGGHTAIGWDKEKHRFITADDRYYVTGEKTKLDKFYSIDIDLDTESVELIPSDDFYIEYAVYSYNKNVVPYSVNDKTLKIEVKDKLFVFDLFDWGNKNKKESYIKIYYPEDMNFDDLNANMDMGSLEITKGSFDKVYINLDMGSLEASDCHLGKAEIDLDMGSMELNNVSLSKLDANLDMGSAELTLLKDGKNDYGYSLEVDLGSIEVIGKEQGRKYEADGDNLIEIECDMGDIEIKEK